MESILNDIGIMKTTLDIPENELKDAIRFTHAKTKREAVVTALLDFNKRQRMAALIKYSGTCRNLLTHDDLMRQREIK